MKSAGFPEISSTFFVSIGVDVWMSSTYAVRKINKYALEDGNFKFFYKETSINARTSINEANALKQSVLASLLHNNRLFLQGLPERKTNI